MGVRGEKSGGKKEKPSACIVVLYYGTTSWGPNRVYRDEYAKGGVHVAIKQTGREAHPYRTSTDKWGEKNSPGRKLREKVSALREGKGEKKPLGSKRRKKKKGSRSRVHARKFGP